MCTRIQCRSMTQFAHHIDACPYIKYIYLSSMLTQLIHHQNISPYSLPLNPYMRSSVGPPIGAYPISYDVNSSIDSFLATALASTSTYMGTHSKDTYIKDTRTEKHDDQKKDDLDDYKLKDSRDVKYLGSNIDRVYCDLCKTYTHMTNQCKYRCRRSRCVGEKYHLHMDHKYD